MSAYIRSILMILGAAGFFGGAVMTICGQPVGMLVLVIGLALLVFGVGMLMQTGGYRKEGFFFNGLGGQGRQQSEVSREPDSGAGEQRPEIWDAMTGKKE